MRWNGGTVNNVSHTELSLFFPGEELEDDDKVMFVVVRGLKAADS